MFAYYLTQSYTPRDNYLSAFAAAQAAEQEYLASETIAQEERALCRRLHEFQTEKHGQRSQPNLTHFHLQSGEEQDRQAQALLNQHQYHTQEQLATRQQQERQLIAERSRCHGLFARQSIANSHDSLQDILEYLIGMAAHSVEALHKPSKVQISGVPVVLRPAPLSNASTAPHQSAHQRRTFSRSMNPADPTPTAGEADALSSVEKLLKSFDGIVCEMPKPTDVPAQETFKKDLSLKEQLEQRLYSDESSETMDIMQAIMASLLDVPDPLPLSSNTSSSSKGKAKAEFAPTIASSSLTQHSITSSKEAIGNVEASLRILLDDFTFPPDLDFLTSTSPTSSDTGRSPTARLSFTARNAPLRYYEQSLNGLLSQLDAVESFGDAELRNLRKETVGRVENALDEMERDVASRWLAKLKKDSKREEEKCDGEKSQEQAPQPADATQPSDSEVNNVEPTHKLVDVPADGVSDPAHSSERPTITADVSAFRVQIGLSEDGEIPSSSLVSKDTEPSAPLNVTSSPADASALSANLDNTQDADESFLLAEFHEDAVQKKRPTFEDSSDDWSEVDV